MAAPHVAGICALILEANPSLKPADVKWLLMDTAVDLGLSRNAQGMGRVDALAAVRRAQTIKGGVSPSRLALSPEAEPVSLPEPGEDTAVSLPEGTPEPTSPLRLGCLGSLLSWIGILGRLSAL